MNRKKYNNENKKTELINLIIKEKQLEIKKNIKELRREIKEEKNKEPKEPSFKLVIQEGKFIIEL